MTVLDDFVVDFDMNRRNHIRIAQLRDVQRMAIRNSRESVDVLLNLVDIDSFGNGLEWDSRCRRTQWDSRMQDDGCDDHGHSWVGIETPAEIGQPDIQGRSDDADIADSVSKNTPVIFRSWPLPFPLLRSWRGWI